MTDEVREFQAVVTVRVKMSVRDETSTPEERDAIAQQLVDNFLNSRNANHKLKSTAVAFSHPYGVELVEAEPAVRKDA